MIGWRKRAYALLAAAVVMLISVPVAISIGRATIEVNGKPLTFTQRDGYTVRRATLTDRFGRSVGRSHLVCFTVSKYEKDCIGVYTFPRGFIRVAGPVLSANSYVLSVTGGSGFYNNARGAMKVTPTGATPRHRVFFQLVG